MDYSTNVIANTEFLSERAREIAADEVDRTKSLDTKAAGIVAIAVALLGAGAAAAAKLADLKAGHGAGVLWAIELSVAVVFVLLAGGLAVWALAPKAVRTAIHIDELETWPTPRVLEQEPTLLVGTVMRGSIDSAGHARTVNNRKARRLGWASWALGAGLACIVALTISLAFHATRRSDTEGPDRPASGAVRRGVAADTFDARRAAVSDAEDGLRPARGPEGR